MQPHSRRCAESMAQALIDALLQRLQHDEARERFCESASSAYRTRGLVEWLPGNDPRRDGAADLG